MNMPTETNQDAEKRELLTRFFNELRDTGNVSAMKYTTEDFIWWHPVLGNFTRADMPGMDASIANMFEPPVAFTIRQILVDGDKAAVEADIDVALKTGDRYQNKYLFLVTLSDGKISHLKEYNNTLHASMKLGFGKTE